MYSRNSTCNVGLVPSKTVLEIFILVVANNNAFDLFATTGTLSYSTSYLRYNKERGERPIISVNDNLCLIYLVYWEIMRYILCTCLRCFCNIQWLLSGRDHNPTPFGALLVAVTFRFRPGYMYCLSKPMTLFLCLEIARNRQEHGLV